MRYPFAFIAILASLASAMPGYAEGPTPLGTITTTRGGNAHTPRPQDHRFAAAPPTPCVEAALPTALTSSGHAFSWADAGVGAAAAAGALLALLGATLIVMQRHG